MSKRKVSKYRKGKVRANRLKRHLAMWKQTGEISKWLAQQCITREDVCRQVLPGMVNIMHPPKPTMDYLNHLAKIYYNPVAVQQLRKAYTYTMWGKP